MPGRLLSRQNRIEMKELVGQKTVRKRSPTDRYFNLIEHAADGIAIVQDGVFKLVNSALVRMSGHDREELLGASFIKLLTPDCQQFVMQRYQDRLAGKEVPSIYEIKAATRDGGVRDIEINAALTEYEGRPADEVIIRDITERKRTEEALRKSEEKYRVLLTNLPQKIFHKDRDSIYVACNDNYAQDLKINADEIIGKKDYDFFPKELAEKYRADDRRIVESGRTEEIEERYVQDGQEQIVRTVKTPIKDENGNVIGILGVFSDITKCKRAEEREKQLQHELNVASRLASIGEMASGIAHEINNPLTGVIGFAQLLMSRDIPDDMRDDLEVINNEAQRVAKIVGSLLTFAHQREPMQEYVDINDITSKVLELRSYHMKVNNIQVVTQLAPDLPPTMADGNQLQQVFLNIILNAEQEMIKAHNGGKLSVKTEKIGSSIRVSFADNGHGISKENLDKMFNPFFTTRDIGDGTGLGLSICHGIVTAHNGRIYAESELGKGATFVVELPIVADTRQMEKPQVIEEEPLRKRAKVLVVDDEKAILDFLKRLLAEQGYDAETVEQANTALQRLHTKRYDLILLDIKLPGMSGIELYRHIETIDLALLKRVMFITGDVMETTTRDFLSKTGASYISKPFDSEQLKRDINRILTERT